MAVASGDDMLRCAQDDRYRRQPLSVRIASRPGAPLVAAYLRRISASERAWYFCGSCDHAAPASDVSKLFWPAAMAAALAVDHGRNRPATSSFRTGIKVGAR